MDKIYAHTYSSIVSLKSHKNQSISRKIKEERRGKGGERKREIEREGSLIAFFQWPS